MFIIMEEVLAKFASVKLLIEPASVDCLTDNDVAFDDKFACGKPTKVTALIQTLAGETPAVSLIEANGSPAT